MASRALRRSPRELGYRGVQVLAFVRQTIEIEGMAPSYGMIRDALGFCDEAGVCRVVHILERRGLLRRVGNGRVRRLRLVVNR
jgi:SOS-response transcriptional repressor LexA